MEQEEILTRLAKSCEGAPLELGKHYLPVEIEVLNGLLERASIERRLVVQVDRPGALPKLEEK